MRLLAIDPGETTGYVVLEVVERDVLPTLYAHGELDTHELVPSVYAFQKLFYAYVPDQVVIEDYRVYAGAAGLHVGMRLHTPELIGIIEAVCVMQSYSVMPSRLPASKKGRWPEARLAARFPTYRLCQSDHVLDALKIGLAYWEGR